RAPEGLVGPRLNMIAGGQGSLRVTGWDALGSVGHVVSRGPDLIIDRIEQIVGGPPGGAACSSTARPLGNQRHGLGCGGRLTHEAPPIGRIGGPERYVPRGAKQLE